MRTFESADKRSDTPVAFAADKVCVGPTAIRLPIKTLPGSNYRTDIAITSVSSRLPRFGRIQTKSGPATPPPLCHVGSFRGHQGSPTDPGSCQGGAGVAG